MTLVKNLHRKFSLLILSIFFLNIISIATIIGIPPANAATPFSLNWIGYVAGGGESLLTYDAIPGIQGEEVFHAGGPVAPNSGGRVTCLNGRTGGQIWTRTIDDLGDTCQMTMVDMDQDGDMELVIPLQHPAGIYILHAENGNIMFGDPTLGGGRIDSTPVAGDVDGDNYPDLFIGIMAWASETFGYEPSTGKIIRYEWNGAAIVERDRVEVWHPCAGGLALCDTDNDGTVELYMNERDVYFGDGSWGRGIMSFWAENLTVRWQVYDWGPSSNIPMLADVNGDGILDVVSTDLSRGVCVLNSTTGRPLRNDFGTLLSSTNTPRRNHYQSSIYDIDNDGNLEILSADGFERNDDYFTVWDLWDWSLDASINLRELGGRSWKGPTVGEVTGDGVMDIVVVCFEVDPVTGDRGGNNGSLQIYNHNYELTHINYGLYWRPIDAVVQDVDRDDGGLNEILVLTQGGRIYCFDTPGLSEELQGRDRARSEIQFYSEQRRGTSEHVSLERPWADIVATSPSNFAVGVSTGISNLYFNLDHEDNELMDYVVTCDPDIISGSGVGTGVGDGWQSVAIDFPLTETTTYHWTVTITDASGHVFTKHYYFTTEPHVPNRAPTQTVPSIVGNTRLDDLTVYNQTTADLDGDDVVNIYNWQLGGTSLANINLPFETQTNPDLEYSGLATTRDYAYGATGAVFGATWIPDGIVGGAYSFDGNDFIRFEEPGSRYDGGGSWDEVSLECWVKATSTTSTERLIWKSMRYDSDYSYRLDYRNRGSRLEFRWYVGTVGDDQWSTSTYYVTSGVSDWHHVVGTYQSGVGVRLYIDGVEVLNNLSPTFTGNILNTDGPFEIAFNSGSDFRGLVDEVRLYPFEVSPALVNQRYLDTKDGWSNSSTIPAQDTEVGDQWRCQVTPNDHITDGNTLNTATVTVGSATNAAPSASNLTITPALPLTTDDLVPSYDYSDPDLHDEYGSLIQWYRDSSLYVEGLVDVIGILDSSATSKGESWYFTITPFDGFDYGTPVDSDPVVIGNTAPSLTDVVITPDPAFPGDTLTANSVGWMDPDEDTETYEYQWQKWNGADFDDIVGQTSQTLLPAHFVAGDTIRVNVTAWDGTDYGNSITATRDIIDSLPPTHDPPILVSNHGGDGTDEDLIATPQNTDDPEGDPVISVFNWIRDTESYTNLVLPFEISSSTTALDYSGYGNDATFYGPTWTSEGVVGGAYNFDGNDVMRVEDSASLGNDGTWSEITLEYWVNPTFDQRGTRILNKNGGDAGDSGKYMTGFNTNGPYNVVFFGIVTDGDYLETYGDSGDVNTTIPSGVWSHIVATYKSGDGFKIYINGELKSSNLGITGNIDASVGEDLFIGYASAIAGTANRYLKGLLDEVRIYPTALSAAQAFQRYIDTKDGLSDSETIVPQETAVGEDWSCQVTPVDGWQNGVTLTSNTIEILGAGGNGYPRIDWYNPSDTTQTMYSDETIIFEHISSDPDSDPLIYNWELDSSTQATTQNWTTSTLSAGTYTVGITVSDGLLNDYQEWMINVIDPIVPQFTSEGVVSGASYSHDPVSPGSIVSVFGVDLASKIAVAVITPLPTTLGGTTVYVNGILCPLYYVSPGQINLQIPYELVGETSALMVIERADVASAPVSIALAAANPGLFTTNMQGTGEGCVLHNADGSVVSTSNPATRGEYIQIYCTGLGVVDPAIASGAAASSDPLSHTVVTPVVTIGGVEAEVAFAGLAPGFVGLYQVTVQVPDTAPIGDVITLVISVDGVTSNIVTLAITT